MNSHPSRRLSDSADPPLSSAILEVQYRNSLFFFVLCTIHTDASPPRMHNEQRGGATLRVVVECFSYRTVPLVGRTDLFLVTQALLASHTASEEGGARCRHQALTDAGSIFYFISRQKDSVEGCRNQAMTDAGKISSFHKCKYSKRPVCGPE